MKIFVLFLAVVFGCQCGVAKPMRVRRFSDQHLADLETRIALNTKYDGIAITMPIGGGKYGVDPWKLGRKRRSEPGLFENEEEDEGDPSILPPLNIQELIFLAKIGLMTLRQNN